jgi:tetratricopeptide (TPR) repeat protein
MAVRLKSKPGLGQCAQNSGIAWQREGEAARERGDETAARRYFKEAHRSLKKSLRVWQVLKDKPHEADSWHQLARILLLLGDLTAAERHAHEACQIYKSLGLKAAWMTYHTLSEIAQARGDTAAAAEWAKKRDDLRAELKRAEGVESLPAQML